MKNLTIQSDNFRILETSFKDWLDILGYAETTINTMPYHVREMLHYLENIKQLTHITQVKERHVNDFMRYLKTRRNLTHGGALSAVSINKTICSINLFARYLNQTGKHVLDVFPRRLHTDVEEHIILTKDEIKTLYEATFEHSRINTTAIGQRDRAIIAVFYGCGLRRNEGIKLNLFDIDLQKGLLLVKKGKGNKQRYVPIAPKNAEDIRNYIEEGRSWFLQSNFSSTTVKYGIKKQNTDDEAFFLNLWGRRMNDFYYRLNILQKRAGIEKTFGLHTLRHSIATHLLQSGMKIEDIARFLGHSTLESTQIYTHILSGVEKSLPSKG